MFKTVLCVFLLGAMSAPLAFADPLVEDSGTHAHDYQSANAYGPSKTFAYERYEAVDPAPALNDPNVVDSQPPRVYKHHYTHRVHRKHKKHSYKRVPCVCKPVKS